LVCNLKANKPLRHKDWEEFLPRRHKDTKQKMSFEPLSEREESIEKKIVDVTQTQHKGIIL
jgi:hypothetical protein